MTFLRTNIMACSHYGISTKHWLVVKEDKVQVTARQEPRMVLIRATCDNDYLTLNAPEMEDLKIPLKLPEINEVLSCKVFGNEVQGRDCGDEASDWITGFLQSVQTYRIVYFEDKMKPRNPRNEYPLYSEDDQVAYPDLAPLLLLSEASVKNLNLKLEKKVSTRNFRPNIVVSGCDAFAEDTWEEIQIGRQVTLKRVMPCPRCILTTVDPDTGIINMKEPLETLRSYRLCDEEDKEVYKSSPLFGQFMKVLKTGKVRVGDPVYHITYQVSFPAANMKATFMK
ncbi:mitochondrial amidoxime reducing component 2-like isoform X2 [Hyla sarda]|uniref:mitochondrial amidoxime reducing component 2-like isoform X2 n=1 Tax=Hyla sarda TaxID=327740 RepID=UPI0024C375F6|nr:mitochondrial amidoxime reducing component 2-like isoform X2 [Hyla sarda]